MEYTKSLGGAWLDADKVVDGSKVKILNETVKRDSQFKDDEGNAKTKNVAKVQFAGQQQVNMRLNWTTIYGLIDAFGNDSKNWIGKPLTAQVKEAVVGDKVRTIIYLIADGFELVKNDEKKLEIRASRRPATATRCRTSTEGTTPTRTSGIRSYQ
jgi:hypothetical protein